MERTLALINAEIEQTKKELEDVHGSTTEVYARIVGYYRSVRNWNKGKREEYKHRKLFTTTDSVQTHLPTSGNNTTEAAPSVVTATTNGSPVSYRFFMRKTCPNCPPVKAYIAECGINGTLVDVDSEEGFNEAAERGVCAAPTVIFFDAAGNECFRGNSVAQLKKLLEKEPAIAV